MNTNSTKEIYRKPGESKIRMQPYDPLATLDYVIKTLKESYDIRAGYVEKAVVKSQERPDSTVEFQCHPAG